MTTARKLTSKLRWLSGGKRGDSQNCSVLYCVLKLCTVISTLRWAVLTVLWIGFCLTGPISLCIDYFVFMFVFVCVLSCHTAYVLYYCNTVGWTWWNWSLILRTFLQCFDTVGWVIWSVKTLPNMTCNVFDGTLNFTQQSTTRFRFPICCCSVSKLKRLKGDWSRNSRPNFALFAPHVKLGERLAKCLSVVLWRPLCPNQWYTPWVKKRVPP